MVITRSYYPFALTIPIDDTDDQYYEISFGPSPRTLRWSLTVPPGRLYILRDCVLRVPRTGTANNVIVETTIQRGAVETHLLSAASETAGGAGSWRVVNAVFDIPAPADTVFRFYTTNTGSSTFVAALSLVLDVVNV